MTRVGAGRCAFLLLAVALLAACGGSESEPSATVAGPTATVDELSTLIAMQDVATSVPTATPIPTQTATPVPTLTPVVTETPAATEQPTEPPEPSATVEVFATVSGTLVLEVTEVAPEPSATPGAVLYPTNTPRTTAVAAAPEVDLPRIDHYWLARPFPRDPTNAVQDYLSRTYPYGSTANGQYQTHHGVDLSNPLGTPILAAGAGWVVYAGDDYNRQVGPKTEFYGNVVIVEHDTPAPNGQPYYTLYGHMSRVDVEAGQRVKAGQEIGLVGATGVALGSHLHLEVRIGDPFDYGSTVNPDLWVQPWPGFGTLAGTIREPSGERVYDATITLRADGAQDKYTFSYADDTVNSDPVWGEDFTRGDLPAGPYRVFVRHEGRVRFEGQITIESGKTTWLDIVLN